MKCIICNIELEMEQCSDGDGTYHRGTCHNGDCSYVVFSDKIPYEPSEYNFKIMLNKIQYHIFSCDGNYPFDHPNGPEVEIKMNSDYKLVFTDKVWVPPNEILNYFKRIMKLKAFL